MAQSPELAGGEGFTFEGEVAAFYLTALLAEENAPGLDTMRVATVSCQQRDFGEPLDDLIVDAENGMGDQARLSLQVKRTLTISGAPTNTDFREVIRDSWATFIKPDFRTSIDRYGAAVGTVSPTKERALKTLCDWARESLSVAHFEHRFSLGGNANKDIKSIRNEIIKLAEEVGKGSKCSPTEVHQFLAHFVLIRFDFVGDGSVLPSEAINRIQRCLHPENSALAPLVWAELVKMARSSAGKSGQIDRARLVRQIGGLARLRFAESLRGDIEKFSELAVSQLNLIQDDVGGVQLDRHAVIQMVTEKIKEARLVQIRGLPGSGKSVLIRRMVEAAMLQGPVLFLKAEQIQGTNWLNYAIAHGISGIQIERLLLEVGITGTPILFIDAIDRIEKEHQPVVLDLIRVILDSELLSEWRIVASLRDTGIEVLRNWLGPYFDRMKIACVSVDNLTDQEAASIVRQHPHLHPLLFGTSAVREIARRPFFTKILNQHFLSAEALTPTPQSEVDLLENWWKMGGYNSAGQTAHGRQRLLLEMGRLQATQLNRSILLSELRSLEHVDGLISDGILQMVRPGLSVRFAHDIFFEWSFFHVLASRGEDWVDEIISCGEPPAVARVVQLSSQWEYFRGNQWPIGLKLTERPDIRSQWLRSWLLGPLGHAQFETDSEQFVDTTFCDNHRLLHKTLVWFQAEKTTPNTNVLSADAALVPQDQRQRFADLLGWPSDYMSWKHLILFLLERIDAIPQLLYPDVEAVFSVWQNALASSRNPVSTALLDQCARWLESIDAEKEEQRDRYLTPKQKSAWATVPDLKSFRASLVQIILRSAEAEPSLVISYLTRLTQTTRLRDELFQEILPHSSTLASIIPSALVDFTLRFFCEELPEDRISRKAKERELDSERRRSIREKPEDERTEQEKRFLSYHGPMHNDDIPYEAWENLSIHDDHRSFWPPSPLREPFHSLFQHAPQEALRLFKALCNHAMSAWRQLHRVSYERRGTPIPLQVTFPWGAQEFWGNEREYLWCRGSWGPRGISSGFLALEDWCLSELSRGTPVDELIKIILHGNHCIAALGTAAILILKTEQISDVTLPLVTSQRLLAADDSRWKNDFSERSASLIGFEYPKDRSHVEAMKTINGRPMRKTRLSWLVPHFIFAEKRFAKQTRASLLGFESNLPYEYEEHVEHPDAKASLLAQAQKYAEMADSETYTAYKVEEKPDQILIVHQSPSNSSPESLAIAKEAELRLQEGGLVAWALKSFEQNCVADGFTLESALSIAKAIDSASLFQESVGYIQDIAGMQRPAVAAAAAMVLCFWGLPNCATTKEFGWARDVIHRAAVFTGEGNAFFFPEASMPWHPAIFASRGIAAEIRQATGDSQAVGMLLALVGHPLEGVSRVALQEACRLWEINPRLSWAALSLSFALCHIPERSKTDANPLQRRFHNPQETAAAVRSVLEWYGHSNGWLALPTPPPAWVEVKRKRASGPKQYSYDDWHPDDLENPEQDWVHPPNMWHSKRASEILKDIPYESILNSGAKEAFLQFLGHALDWTIQRIAPPWVKANQRHREPRKDTSILEWTGSLGEHLGVISGLLPIDEFRVFLDPVLSLQGELCWDFLDPLVSSAICRYVFDATEVPAPTMQVLGLCLERMLEDSAFNKGGYYSGDFQFSGFHLPRLIKSFMFVGVERAELAARFVNGDWSQIGLILPMIDRLVRAGGWTVYVMGNFLTLAERAKFFYPAEEFADQILSVFSNGSSDVKGWHGTFIMSRIAELVPFFAHQNSPLPRSLALKFLRILDILVDMGDRRSAALQLTESFRSIRLR